jgi:predicted O-methyltransferase YrrM
MLGESHTKTASADLCADPDYWHSVDRSSTEVEVSEMIGGIVRGLQPDVCVELGSYMGQTSRAIATALRQSGHGWLYALDTDVRCVRTCQTVLAGLPAVAVLVDAGCWIPPPVIDFIWVDHGDVNTRIAAVEHLLSHLSRRAVVCWHDAGSYWTLGDQLRRAFGPPLWSLLFLPTPRGVAIMRPLT